MNTTQIEGSTSEISREQIGKHEKTLQFHAAFGRPHTLSVFIDGYLNQYISINDDALDAMIQKRDEMRAYMTGSKLEA